MPKQDTPHAPTCATDPLPCPFCGEEPIIEPWHGGGPLKRIVRCANDECLVSPSVTGARKSTAVSHWNSRAPKAEAGS